MEYIFRGIWLIILVVFGFNTAHTQNTFDRAYFIDNSGNRIECFINSKEFLNNPSSFEYKLSEEGEVKDGSINSVQLFEIYNKQKFVRHRVEIEVTDHLKPQNMSSTREPSFEEKTVFLRVLIEGSASLFFYRHQQIQQYYFSLGDESPELLVYKRFLNNSKNIGENNTFKQQLFNHLKCETIKEDVYGKLSYSGSSLVSLFKHYNECLNSTFVNYKEMKKQLKINLNIRPGVSQTAMEISRYASRVWDVDLGKHQNFRLGLELEILLPLKNERFAVIFESHYNKFSSEVFHDYTSESAIIQRTTNVKMEYNSLNFSLGMRHYFYLSQKSRLFVNGMGVIGIPVGKETFHLLETDVDRAYREGLNFAVGAGYNYNDKFGIEFRNDFNREVSDIKTWEFSYKSVSLIFSYTLL